MDWLYRTSTTQSIHTDASGHPYTKDVWEAHLLWGALVYQSARLVPDSSFSSGPPTNTSLPNPSPSTRKPITLAEKVAHEPHWLDVDRTGDSRAQSPDFPDSTEDNQEKKEITPSLSVGVLGYNVFGKGSKPQEGDTEKKARVAHESHWLDIDRVADSRAESPELREPAGGSEKREKEKENTVKEVMGSPLKKTVGSSPLADPKNH